MDINTVIIEDSRNRLSEKLNCLSIQYGNQTEDQQIHDWLIPKLSELESVEKIVIPIRLGLDDIDYKGLRLGLHIRLSEELVDKRYSTIILISEDNKELILTNQIKGDKELTGLFLFTPGVFLSSVNKLKDNLSIFHEKINHSILHQSVLPNLIIQNQRDLGHQLANEWGVFRLARFASINLNKKLPADLYFKYKLAHSKAILEPEKKNGMGPINKNINVLLIDDNANIGWSELLKNLIEKWLIAPGKKCHFEAVETFDEAYEKNDFARYDIVFLDLRLKPEEDKPNTNLPIEDFSGYKLLQKIKGINKGIQVIILTASNKAWNMKKLLDKGADGYFIKESPEYNFSDSFSFQNYEEFKLTVINCIRRKQLRELFEHVDNALKNNDNPDKDFISESASMLEIAWSLINEEKYDFAYLTLFQILEAYADKKYNIKTNSIQLHGDEFCVIEDLGDEKEWKLKFVDTKDGKYFIIKNIRTNSTNAATALFKLSCLLAFQFQKDNEFLKYFGKLNKIRNKIAHDGAKGFALKEKDSLLKLLDIICLFRSNP